MPLPPNTPDGTPPDLSPVRITVPPNTPFNHGSPARSRRPTRTRNSQSPDEPGSYEVGSSGYIDFRNLKYISEVDENLVCPICRVALIKPVTTICDHTFCRECLQTAWDSNKSCPIDRRSLNLPEDIIPSPKIVLNQLDALKVRCLCCGDPLPRSMLRNHLNRYCSNALVKCLDESCEKLVMRKDEGRGCLHRDAVCPDCEEHHQEIDMDSHRELDCQRREAACEHCEEAILKCKQAEHLSVCPEVITPCKWTKYGCREETLRKDADVHVAVCSFNAVGLMADMLQAEISTLREQVQGLSEKDKNRERRIKFLETHPHFSFSEVSSQTVSRLPDSTPSTEFPESRDQYLLSLLESQESKVDQLSAGMTELEAKQTMMLFNETIQIKEQLAELRSAQGVIGMHVRWLMNFRMQERRPGPGPGSTGGSESGGPGGEGHRRLSDTMRDVITKL
ncbi:traf-like signal [Phlyctema vagabunda]|uniref:Traf-like signal n=1 Tax=Phlyctema vagabunda TaxID=108571 RepID=A0ABR4PF70_9HELO